MRKGVSNIEIGRLLENKVIAVCNRYLWKFASCIYCPVHHSLAISSETYSMTRACKYQLVLAIATQLTQNGGLLQTSDRLKVTWLQFTSMLIFTYWTCTGTSIHHQNTTILVAVYVIHVVYHPPAGVYGHYPYTPLGGGITVRRQFWTVLNLMSPCVWRNCDSIEKWPGDLPEAPIANVTPGNVNFDFRLITQLSRVSLLGLACG